ncbi:MAG TPA: nickel insertion protein, partial [Dehalococcoidia bacterium]|nr:nickel insertion protein [Dehalococcoidia bacterium]
MLLGALLDAGLELPRLEAELKKLRLPGYHLSAAKISRNGFAAIKVGVRVEEEQPERGLAEVLAVIETSSLPAEDKEKAVAVFRCLAEAEARVHGCPVEEVRLHDVGAVDAIVDVVGAVCGLRLLEVEELFASPLNVGAGLAKGPHGPLPIPAPATLQILSAAQAPLAAPGAAPQSELLTP